jgi:hypothetical protein
MHHARRRRSVAIHGVADYVLHCAARDQRVPGRRGGEVVARELHADAQRGQARIVERLEAVARDEYIRGAVIRARVQGALEVRGNAHPGVANVGAERLAHKAAALRLPLEVQLGAELRGQQPRQAVLEAAFVARRERQVVRLGADAKLRRSSRKRQQQERDQAREAQTHAACLPSPCSWAGPSWR